MFTIQRLQFFVSILYKLYINQNFKPSLALKSNTGPCFISSKGSLAWCNSSEGIDCRFRLLHLAHQNYFARALWSDCIDLDSWLSMQHLSNVFYFVKYNLYTHKNKFKIKIYLLSRLFYFSGWQMQIHENETWKNRYNAQDAMLNTQGPQSEYCRLNKNTSRVFILISSEKWCSNVLLKSW